MQSKVTLQLLEVIGTVTNTQETFFSNSESVSDEVRSAELCVHTDTSKNFILLQSIDR